MIRKDVCEAQSLPLDLMINQRQAKKQGCNARLTSSRITRALCCPHSHDMEGWGVTEETGSMLTVVQIVHLTFVSISRKCSPQLEE